MPVRDEEQRLPALLTALAAQQSDAVDLVACFFLDGCSDRSPAILHAAAASFPYRIIVAEGPRHASPNAGRARRAAMALGLDHARATPDGLILSTDADSRPRPDWVAAARRALREADFAAGILVRSANTDDAVQTRVEHYYDRLHAFRRAVDPVAWDPGTGRHFSGGANLAFRAAAYVAVGGFRPIACSEDAVLLDDASRAGFRVRRDPAMIVDTSSRRVGRVAGGLAAALQAIDVAGPPLVPHPAAAIWQYEAHAVARRAFGQLHDPAIRGRLGALIGLDADHVLGVGRDCRNAEAFAMRIVPAAPFDARDISLAQAEDALALVEAGLCATAA